MASLGRLGVAPVAVVGGWRWWWDEVEGTGGVPALEWPVAPCAMVGVDTGAVPVLE